MATSLCLHLRVSVLQTILLISIQTANPLTKNIYHSLVETNVAIMVSSMPAASGIMRRKLRESSLYRSFHKSSGSSNDDSAKRHAYFQNNYKKNPLSGFFLSSHSRSANKSTFDRRQSSESLRALQLKPSDLEMQLGGQPHRREEDMGPRFPGRAIIRTTRIDQDSFRNMAIM